MEFFGSLYLVAQAFSLRIYAQARCYATIERRMYDRYPGL
jgi:hypothetical protein